MKPTLQLIMLFPSLDLDYFNNNRSRYFLPSTVIVSGFLTLSEVYSLKTQLVWPKSLHTYSLLKDYSLSIKGDSLLFFIFIFVSIS